LQKQYFEREREKKEKLGKRVYLASPEQDIQEARPLELKSVTKTKLNLSRDNRQ
jgi:hypothetical protein